PVLLPDEGPGRGRLRPFHGARLALDLDEHSAGAGLALPAGRLRVPRLGSPPRVIVFAGSIRSGALSQKLADVAAKELALAEADVTKVSLADYPLPIYNGDLETEKGIPENALKLARLIAAQQGVFIATPEYNNSPPPL